MSVKINGFSFTSLKIRIGFFAICSFITFSLKAISYIVGQLNSPISQLVNFVHELQDAKISIDRLSEIHSMKEEEPLGREIIHDVPKNSDLTVNNLSFRYPGMSSEVLNNLCLTIPANKITAIVGTSGSGKTTLMKLLLKFYPLNEGKIEIGGRNLDFISQHSWRNLCGAVMQEGYIFNDTVANNIAVGVDFIDKEKLVHAVEVANIKSFIETLPLSYNTKIGIEGSGLSTGQKQRILIARAVYKSPKLLFFDEATSSLDANNEKVIMERLNVFFADRTVVIIAHRLSTVKNADQILVLEEGRILERGTHKELTKLKGRYYNLVKNQLELGT